MTERQKSPSDAADRFQVRMPDGMRDRLAEAARKSGRSMNTEIVERLEASLNADKEVDGWISELFQKVETLQGQVAEHDEALKELRLSLRNMP